MRGRRDKIILAAIAALLSPIARGQVRTFEIRGSAVDINSQPLANIAVSVHASELGPERKTLTGMNGAFSFGNLPSGHYSLQATASGYNTVRAGDVDVGPPHPVIALLLPMESASACPLTPSLQHYFRTLDVGNNLDHTALAGTIIDEKGLPIRGAGVALFIPSQGRTASTHTDTDGSFSFTHLTTDKNYWIQVSKDGYLVGEFTNLDSRPGYESIYDDLVLEKCEPENCDPNLRKTQTLRCE